MIMLSIHNKRLHADCHKLHGFCIRAAKVAPLMASGEAGVIRTLPLSLQGSDNASLPGNLSKILLSGLFRSATEPDNKTFDRRFALIIVAVAAIISAKAPVNAALCIFEGLHANRENIFTRT